MSVFLDYELWVDVPVFIFFNAVDCKSERPNRTLCKRFPSVGSAYVLFYRDEKSIKR